MPCVSHLRLEWGFHDDRVARAIADMDLLLTRILFPNLTTLQLELTAFDELNNRKDNVSVEHDLLRGLLYEYPAGIKLRFLNLRIFELQTNNLYAYPAGDYFFPIHDFRELRQLILKGIPTAMFPSEDREAASYCASHRPPSSLQSITLEDCDGVTNKAIALFVEALQKVNQGMGWRRGQLEQVHVSGVRCKKIDEVELGTPIGGTELLYYPE